MSTGVHLRRTDENVREIDAMATLLGGRVGVDAVLDDLNRQARRTFLTLADARRIAADAAAPIHAG